MVMTTNALIPVTYHRPATLEMQCNGFTIKAKGVEIGPGGITDLNRQILKIRMLMQLLDTIDISSPGAAIRGINNGLSAQVQQRLQLAASSSGSSWSCSIATVVEKSRWRCITGPIDGRQSTQKNRSRRTGLRVIKTDSTTSGSRATDDLKNLLGNRSLTGLVVVKGQRLG